ncbi:hypothetical protein RM533_06510 [Croceicoccus sp. F390]|uniref:Uncharacterized protein n=1 Tax=Croceicoccus esteveae TaxID=3075597 RepID=A0ABU2ZJU4_9SPHN|nr:hypothetical protein [Croceicoccus sp. F390]MDT0575834.1 hypothetical protein [Croceicoccus sp. F390]
MARTMDGPQPAQVGFITMAFGADKYFAQAETLARSLRRHMPGYAIAIVTDRADAGPLFDITVPMDPVDIAGTVLKTDLYRYSPFAETLFIDSDCVVARDFTPQLQQIRAHDFTPVVGRYLSRGDQDLWIRDVGAAIEKVGGTKFPKFNGGVYFWRKSPFAQEVFRRAIAIRARADELGILDFDRSGPGEETLIGLALSQMHVIDLYDDGGMLMRTPLNSTGPVHLDVIGGACRFIKEGEEVTPAICHFCGEWIDHPAYLIAQHELLRGQRLPEHRRLRTRLAYRSARFAQRIRSKIRRTWLKTTKMERTAAEKMPIA